MAGSSEGAVPQSFNRLGVRGVAESPAPTTLALGREYVQRWDVASLVPLPLPWRPAEVEKARELGDLRADGVEAFPPGDAPRWFTDEYPLLASIDADGMNNFSGAQVLALAQECEAAGADPRLGASVRLAFAGRVIRRAASRTAYVRVPGR